VTERAPKPELFLPWALWGLGLLPAVIAVLQLGRLHPDEVYQWLEPAYFRAHGYGVVAWEWKVGLRNWVIPGLFAEILRLADRIGLTHPQAYRALIAIPQVLFHLATVFAVYRWARRRGESGVEALVFASYGMVLLFAGRTLGESISADFLVLALERMDAALVPGRLSKKQEAMSSWLAGAFLGAAVIARYGSAIMVVCALVGLLILRRWRTALWVVLGGTGVAAFLGIVDLLTWGAPFHSLREYVRFNLLSDGAVRNFGAQPWTEYLLPLLACLPVWVWPALWRRALGHSERIGLSMALVYGLSLLLTPHKEARFLYPAFVLVMLVASFGLPGLLQRIHHEGIRKIALAGGISVSLLSGVLFPWDLRADQFRAIVRASRDATGLLIVNEGLWGAGGYFYLGKNIPWLTCDEPTDSAFVRAMADSRFNRAVTFEARALQALQTHGFVVDGVIGRETLLVRREATSPGK
jgi:phosphatidylinositol glycan class B